MLYFMLYTIYAIYTVIYLEHKLAKNNKWLAKKVTSAKDSQMTIKRKRKLLSETYKSLANYCLWKK